MFSYHTLQYIHRTLQFIVFLTISSLNKTSNRAVTNTFYKMHEHRICIYKTSLPHRPDDYTGFTSSCPPYILQQNCAHAYNSFPYAKKHLLFFHFVQSLWKTSRPM